MKKLILLPVLMLVAMQLNAAVGPEEVYKPKNYLRLAFGQAKHEHELKKLAQAASTPAPAPRAPKVVDPQVQEALENAAVLRTAEFRKAARASGYSKKEVAATARKARKAREEAEDYRA